MGARADSLRAPLFAAVCALLLSACASGPPQAPLRLEESTLDVRALQTRKLAAPTEAAILTATIAVLQDMEFNIDRIEKALGVISASKVSDADDKSEKTGLFFLDLLCAMGGGSGCDQMSTARDEQRLIVTIVVRPSLERSGDYAVRITLQRIIYDQLERILTLERINTPDVYQNFFNNLRTALYLEVNET